MTIKLNFFLKIVVKFISNSPDLSLNNYNITTPRNASGIFGGSNRFSIFGTSLLILAVEEFVADKCSSSRLEL